MSRMKSVLAVLAFVLIPASLMAGDQSTQSTQGFQGIRLGACSHWRIADNSPGYICATYPETVTVADAYSYADTIRALEARIAVLEKQLAELQAKAHTHP